MKKFAAALSFFTVFCLVLPVFAVDKAAVSNNVDAIVQAIEAGQDITGLKAETMKPYAFIMKEDGQMLVHPTLAGKNLKEAAEPVYNALLEATPEGVWVEYEWKGKQKNTFARKTATNLIVGSGY